MVTPEPDKHNFLPIRIKVETYHKLAELKEKRKKENLNKTGKVGDANFNTIIEELLKQNDGKLE